jgi:dienelactone hydrolase
VWTSVLRLRGDGAGRATVGPELLTGMRPPDGESDFAPRLGRNAIRLELTAGKAVRRATLVREMGSERTAFGELTVADDGLAGWIFAPDHPHGDAVVLVGGSEGGYDSYFLVAAQLAAEGHPALVLGYFDAPGLPRRLRRIPVETVWRGVDLLRHATSQRHDVALLGASRGGELVLLAAALQPTLVDEVIALVPSSLVGRADDMRSAAWTLGGRPIAPGLEIPVTRIRGDVLAAGAGQDASWFSKAFVDDIAGRMDGAAGARLQRVQYEGAGHGIGSALPYLPEGTGTSMFGGTARANAAARADLWARILRLLSPGTGS